jgi:hypothetical protein
MLGNWALQVPFLCLIAFPYCAVAWTDVFGIRRSVHFLPSPLACPLISCPYYVWLPAEPQAEQVLHCRWNWMNIRKASENMEFTQLSADISSSFGVFGCEYCMSWNLIFKEKSKRIPSIFKDENTGSCIYLWKLAVAVATYVSICIVYRILPSFVF